MVGEVNCVAEWSARRDRSLAREKSTCAGSWENFVQPCARSWSVGMGIDGIQGAERVDQSGACVHGHGNAEGFGDFLFGGAGFEGGIGVEGDAAVATHGDGNGNGNELADFLAEERVFGVGGREGLVALERIRRELGEIGNGFGEFGLIVVPIEEHGVPPEVGCRGKSMASLRLTV